jgi:hypothetical protein
VHAVGVALSGPDPGQVDVPLKGGAVAHVETSRLHPIVVEEAQLDAFGVL